MSPQASDPRPRRWRVLTGMGWITITTLSDIPSVLDGLWDVAKAHGVPVEVLDPTPADERLVVRTVGEHAATCAVWGWGGQACTCGAEKDA